MGEQVIEGRARSAAPPEAVYALLADVTTWSRWGIWTVAEVERPDPSGGGGVGAVRLLRSRSFGRTIDSRERVVELEPGQAYGYALLSGLPLRGYRSRVELTPDGAGTAIRWSSRFERATPGLTWLYRRVLSRVIGDAATRLAQYAERARSAA
jgi:hypothetical protein